MRRLDELGALPAELSLRVAERWHEVEDAIKRWRGIDATREEVDAIYCEAVMDATGRSRLEVYDDWLGRHGDLEPVTE